VSKWKLQGFALSGTVTAHDGIYVTNAQEGFELNDVSITSFTNSSYGRGVLLRGFVSSGVYFGNFFRVRSNGNYVGVRAETSDANYRCNVHRFYGCDFISNISDGIQIDYGEGFSFIGCETEDNGGYGVNIDNTSAFLFEGGWIEHNYSGLRNINFTANSYGMFLHPKMVLGTIFYGGVAVAAADLGVKMRFLFASNSSADAIAVNWMGQVDRMGGTNRAVDVHERAASGQDTQKIWVAGDSYGRLTITSNGKLSWGSGSALMDVGLIRSAANILALDAGDSFKLDRVRFNVLTAEPGTPADGDVAYANGTSWNPGGGAGLYVRTGAAWVKVH
jgi:hypothetical protein